VLFRSKFTTAAGDFASGARLALEEKEAELRQASSAPSFSSRIENFGAGVQSAAQSRAQQSVDPQMSENNQTLVRIEKALTGGFQVA